MGKKLFFNVLIVICIFFLYSALDRLYQDPRLCLVFAPERLRYSRVTDFLDPWEGGWWRLRDIIEYEKAATYSVLDLAATYKEKFMYQFYRLNREAIRKGGQEPPFAYIIPIQ